MVESNYNHNMSVAVAIKTFFRCMAYLFCMQGIFLLPTYVIALSAVLFYAIFDFFRLIVKKIIRKQFTMGNEPALTVMINGAAQTAVLRMARSLHMAGVRVVACDIPQHWLSPTRFSQATDEYYTVAPPADSMAEYVRTLSDIVDKEKVDLFIPTSSAEGGVYDAMVKGELEQLGCSCFSPHPDPLRLLTNKEHFYNHVANRGLTVPLHHRVSTVSEILTLYDNGTIVYHGPFVMTSQSVGSLDEEEDFFMPSTADEFLSTLGDYDSDGCPFLLERYIPGKRVNSCTVFNGGNVVAHAAASRAPPLLHDPKHTRDTQLWIENFVQSYPVELSGIFTFRFVISSEDGKLYPLGCGAGISSAFSLLTPSRQLGRILSGQDIPHRPVVPNPKFAYVYWFYQELWQCVHTIHAPRALACKLIRLFRGKEAVFDFSDPLPFIALNHLHLPFLLFSRIVHKRRVSGIDFPSGVL